PPSLFPRAGAGLELDLASPRHNDRLPTELRGLLPNQGLVNFLEAQTLVRRLETLAADAEFRASLQRSASCPSDCADVAVLALYPAQAELIRNLLRQSPALAAARLNIEVAVPAAFRQRECRVALVSLTRSHGHRAVSLGEGPHALALALTRARQR